MSDKWIRERALADGMIEPFVDGQRREGTISFGLSSYGYDARVADEIKTRFGRSFAPAVTLIARTGAADLDAYAARWSAR